jgi:hypothetical protein
MLDRQSIYERVAAHLLLQGEPAVVVPGDEPIYGHRTPSGLRCAIGILIDDAVFDPELNQTRVIHADVLRMLVASGLEIDMAGDDVDFLRDLEAVHDDASPKGDWLGQVVELLEQFRRTYELSGRAEAGEPVRELDSVVA